MCSGQPICSESVCCSPGIRTDVSSPPVDQSRQGSFLIRSQHAVSDGDRFVDRDVCSCSSMTRTNRAVQSRRRLSLARVAAIRLHLRDSADRPLRRAPSRNALVHCASCACPSTCRDRMNCQHRASSRRFIRAPSVAAQLPVAHARAHVLRPDRPSAPDPAPDPRRSP